MRETGERLVKIAVENTVFHFDKPFTYRVPAGLAGKIQPGVRVTVPFGTGNRPRVGMVLSLDGEDSARLKSVLSVLDREPVLTEEMLELAVWMKEHYFCTLFEAVKLMIPSGINYRLQNSYVLNDSFKDFDRENYSELQWRLIMLLRAASKSVPFQKISGELGIEETNPDFQSLLEREILFKVNTALSKVGDAVSKMVRPVSDFTGKLTPRQSEVLRVLTDVGMVSEKELCYFTGASQSVVRALVDKGAAETFEFEVYRRPGMAPSAVEQLAELTLSEEQHAVYEALCREYEQGTAACSLLYGVTGSGKSSVFLKLIDYVCGKGRDVIVMVPEISLTAQTIRLFQEHFGDVIAVFHSGLSLGERLDEWKRVRRGEAKIVVGTRSAVFAPVQNLGLIVIDEEQEHTYKSESSPRYDAREVAKYRCYRNQAFCLLSSATPSMESCYQAKNGKYSFHKLEMRFGEAQIPQVELIDMNEESVHGNDTAFSEPLRQALSENFEKGRQSIILLNRRGYHTFASCNTCRETVTCPNCSISLTYHSANRRLMCHYCGYSIPFTTQCPSCGSNTVTFRGAGTQRAEEQLQELLPNARVLRVDTDSVSARFSLEKKLADFAEGRYDIMVGTQMVAKGLNFENVTLVGVLSADQSLYSDDFRSNERTFDLLTQVVGRAGRGSFSGTAMIQTFVPENEFLHLAAQQDYFGFYDREIVYRQALLYPPFVDLLVVGFVGEKEAGVRNAAEFFLAALSRLAKEEYPKLPLRVLRPSPAAVVKMSNKYRYKLIMKCRNTAPLREMVTRLLIQFAKEREFQQVTAYADTNPYTIL